MLQGVPCSLAGKARGAAGCAPRIWVRQALQPSCSYFTASADFFMLLTSQVAPATTRGIDGPDDSRREHGAAPELKGAKSTATVNA